MHAAEPDVVRGLLDHWERGEFAPSLGHLHRDVVVVNRISGRGFEGHGGVRRLIGDFDQAFEKWSLKVDELRDCPDGGRLAVGNVVLHGKKTGAEMDRPVALLFALDDGLIVRIEFFVNRIDEAFAAAGLERS